MYLRGLGTVTTIPNTDAATCSRAGGAWSQNPDIRRNDIPGQGAYWVSSQQGTCTIITPDAPPPSAPANVTVNTSTNTQVSPQISPNLIQQQQPKDSPITAGTVSAPSDRMVASSQGTEDVQLIPQSAPASPAVSYFPDTTAQAAPATVAPAENFFVKNAPYEMIGLAILAGLGMIAMSRKK